MTIHQNPRFNTLTEDSQKKLDLLIEQFIQQHQVHNLTVNLVVQEETFEKLNDLLVSLEGKQTSFRNDYNNMTQHSTALTEQLNRQSNSITQHTTTVQNTLNSLDILSKKFSEQDKKIEEHNKNIKNMLLDLKRLSGNFNKENECIKTLVELLESISSDVQEIHLAQSRSQIQPSVVNMPVQQDSTLTQNEFRKENTETHIHPTSPTQSFGINTSAHQKKTIIQDEFGRENTKTFTQPISQVQYTSPVGHGREHSSPSPNERERQKQEKQKQLLKEKMPFLLVILGVLIFVLVLGYVIGKEKGQPGESAGNGPHQKTSSVSSQQGESQGKPPAYNAPDTVSQEEVDKNPYGYSMEGIDSTLFGAINNKNVANFVNNPKVFIPKEYAKYKIKNCQNNNITSEFQILCLDENLLKRTFLLNYKSYYDKNVKLQGNGS